MQVVKSKTQTVEVLQTADKPLHSVRIQCALFSFSFRAAPQPQTTDCIVQTVGKMRTEDKMKTADQG